MGIIKLDVKNIYLAKHPKQERMLKPFLNGFDITMLKHVGDSAKRWPLQKAAR